MSISADLRAPKVFNEYQNIWMQTVTHLLHCSRRKWSDAHSGHWGCTGFLQCQTVIKMDLSVILL